MTSLLSVIMQNRWAEFDSYKFCPLKMGICHPSDNIIARQYHLTTPL